MAEVAFRVVSSFAQESEGNPLKALNKVVQDWRTADTKSKAAMLCRLQRNAAGNFYRFEEGPTAENGHLVLATAQALTEAGLAAEVQRLCSMASDRVKPGHRPATCFLLVAGAIADANEGCFSEAAAKIDHCGKLLCKISGSDLSIAEAKLLLTEYTKILGVVAREQSIHCFEIESLAARGQELISLVNKWGMSHTHLNAGGYVALGLWKLAQALDADGKPSNSMLGSSIAVLSSARSAITSWEKLGGSPEVLMTCCHLLAKFFFSRERWSATALYLTKARQLAEELGDYISLGSIILDQLHLHSAAPSGRVGQKGEDLEQALALIWAYLKDAESPLEVRSSFAFNCHLVSGILGREIVTATELDQVLLDTLEHCTSSSTDIPESAQSVLLTIASQDQIRLLGILQAAHARLPIELDPSDALSCVLSQVLDYLSIIGTLQSDSCRAATEAIAALIAKRETELRERDSDEAGGAAKVQIPLFHAALVRIARAAFQNPGGLHLESEERLLSNIATTFRRAESGHNGLKVVSRITGLLVMLNSKSPNWKKISRTASRLIPKIEPLVVSNYFSDSDVEVVRLAFFIRAVALHKLGDIDGAAQSFESHYAMVSNQQNPRLAEEPRILNEIGIRCFDRFVERKKLALFIYHMDLSLHPEHYSSELENDDAAED